MAREADGHSRLDTVDRGRHPPGPRRAARRRSGGSARLCRQAAVHAGAAAKPSASRAPGAVALPARAGAARASLPGHRRPGDDPLSAPQPVGAVHGRRRAHLHRGPRRPRPLPEPPPPGAVRGLPGAHHRGGAAPATAQRTGELYRAGAAAELSLEREKGLRGLRRAGALVLEAPAAQLPTAVVNQYLRIKARRLL